MIREGEPQPTIQDTLTKLQGHYRAGAGLNTASFLTDVHQVSELGFADDPKVDNLLKLLGRARRNIVGGVVLEVLHKGHQTSDVGELNKNIKALRMLGLDTLPDVNNLIGVLTKVHGLEEPVLKDLPPPVVLPEPPPVETGQRRVNIGFADLILIDASMLSYINPLSYPTREYLFNVSKVIDPSRVDNYLRDNPVLAFWASTHPDIQRRALARLTPEEIRAYFNTKPDHILTIHRYLLDSLSPKAREELRVIAAQITPEGLTQALRKNPLLAYQIRTYESLDLTQAKELNEAVTEAENSEEQRERVSRLVEKDPSLLLGFNWDGGPYSSTYFLTKIVHSTNFEYVGEAGKVELRVRLNQAERQAVLGLKKAAGAILEEHSWWHPTRKTAMAEFETAANLPASESSLEVTRAEAVSETVSEERYNLHTRLSYYSDVAPILQQVFATNSQPVLGEALEKVIKAREARNLQDYDSEEGRAERRTLDKAIDNLDNLIGEKAGITEQDKRKAEILSEEVDFWRNHTEWDLLRALKESTQLDPSLGRDIIDATRAYNRAQLEHLRFGTELDTRWNKVFTGFLKKAGYKLQKTGLRSPNIVPQTKKDKILGKFRGN